MAGLIGQRIPRIEDRAFLTGKGRYVDDIDLPGLLHAAFLRSSHAHAMIKRIDSTAAKALPGVHAILTLDDLMPVLTRRRMSRGGGKMRETISPCALSDGEVCYVGETVALVVAESRYIAEDAAALIEVDYEPLPAVVDGRTSGAASTPKVRSDAASNQITSYKVGYGDIAAAFKNAAHVFKENISQHRGGAHPIEGRGIVAELRASDGSLTLWASTQKSHDMFGLISELLDLDENQLRVVTPDVGGGFGPKLLVYPEDVSIAAAAKLLGRSIKWIEDRREHFLAAVQERDQFWNMEIAVDGEGRILGLRGHLIHDQGAYALQDINLPYNSASAVPGPYIVPTFEMEVSIIQTNKTPVSSVRGAGYPQAAYAMERLMDLVARELKVDRAEVRDRNFIPADKMPYEKPLKARSGQAIWYDSGDYPACQVKILEAADWKGFPKRQAEALKQGRYIGIGISSAVKGTGRGPFESGLVRVANTGKVSVYTGAAPMGQGLHTALAQICAEQLGLKPEDISVVAGDTATVPLGLGGFASRQLITAGSSVLLATQAVAKKARKLASDMLEAAEEDLEFVDGKVRVVGSPDLAVKLGDLARALRGAPGYAFPEGLEPGLEAFSNFRTDQLAYANVSHVVEVEVDIDTGGVKILRYLSIQDSGTLINPMIVEGQVIGGIAHGISNALFEWMGYDESGQPTTTTFAEYLLPTACDVPHIETFYEESPSPLNPLGAKGVGEVGTIPAVPAIMSAIEDALKPFGVRISETPLSPMRLSNLIAEKRRNGKGA
jgi:carbon-monoxide dehydrogenase large subunit